MTAEFETSEEAEAVDAATRAFEDLRTEIAGLRQVVEALGPAIATGRAPDYSPTLGAIAKTLQAATLRIDAIAKHTGANLATEIARREIARVYDESLRPARLDLERSTREVLDAVNVVNGAVAKVRTGRGQRAWILRSSAIGLVVGLVAFPLLLHPVARLLPAHWNIPERMATSALGRQGWDAGALLMQADSPSGWKRLTEADAVVRAGGEELKACQDAATKAAKDQRCMIVVKPAGRKPGIM
jgi:hypothetical protein